MIDKNASTPMYEQISALLRSEILQKKYGSHGCIGTHTELATRFNVSLITIRRAVQMLADENLVDIRQGKGTFVRGISLQDDLKRLTGASVLLQQSKLSAQVTVPVFEFIDTPAKLDSEVRDGLGKRCLHIVRVHHALRHTDRFSCECKDFLNVWSHSCH